MVVYLNKFIFSRILTVESADEFYCIMGVLTREMLEFGLMDANGLIKVNNKTKLMRNSVSGLFMQ